MVKSWLSVPEPCPADWDAMPRGDGGRTRHCAACDVHLLDTVRMTAAEVDRMLRWAEEAGGPMPCINLCTRNGGPRFADSPDVPLTSLRRRAIRPAMVGVAAMAVMACKPRATTQAPCHDEKSGRATCVEDDDHVDGEVLSPTGGNMPARGQARRAPLYAPPPTLHDEAFGPEPGSPEAEARAKDAAEDE